MCDRHLDAAKTMVELGADVDAQSAGGVALDIAKREGKADVVAWLVNLR
jgi:ankyrin repeat protein